MTINYLEKITDLHCFVSSDAGGEGLVAALINGVFMPFVCADKERIDSFRPIAKRMGEKQKIKIKLVRFSVREEIEDIC